MKALSIRQPWAWLIVNGYKDVENRSWRSRHRGDTLIHAGKRDDPKGYAWVRAVFPQIEMPPLHEMRHGGIVGRTRIVDCVDNHDSPWFSGPHGLVVDPAASRPLPFRPLRGLLYFFDVPPDPDAPDPDIRHGGKHAGDPWCDPAAR